MTFSDWFRRLITDSIEVNTTLMNAFSSHSDDSRSGEEETAGSGTSRFTPVSENDGMLLSKQLEYIKQNLAAIDTEIWFLTDPSDPMLPEYSSFTPNVLAEFDENSNLAMIHGLGTAHAWIDVSKLREMLAVGEFEIQDYRSLFRAFSARGYDVKKIKYINFRSAFEHWRG